MKFPFKTWDPTLVLYILWHRETAHCILIYWYPIPTILRPVPGIPIESAYLTGGPTQYVACSTILVARSMCPICNRQTLG